MRQCTIEGCAKFRHGTGKLCAMHRWRKQKYGDPEYVKWPRHGDFKTPEHKTWSKLKGRCLNPKDRDYADYGGRGIKVCDRWKVSYLLFLEDMGKRPSSKHSINRINNDGDYEPGNCEWSTINVQAANRRNNNTVVGVCFGTQSRRWIATLKVNKQYVLRKNFVSYEEAVAARKQAELLYLPLTNGE